MRRARHSATLQVGDAVVFNGYKIEVVGDDGHNFVVDVTRQ